jgi:WD40 repeat protein
MDGGAGGADGGDGGGSDGAVAPRACQVLGRGTGTFAALAPDGATFVLADDALLEVRDWATGAVLFTNGFFGASAVAYSGDGTQLIASTHAGARGWAVPYGISYDLPADMAEADVLASSADGGVVAAGRAEALGVLVWRSGSLLRIVDMDTGPPIALGVSPDGTLVVAGYAIYGGGGNTSPVGYAARAWLTTDGSTAWTSTLGTGMNPGGASSAIGFTKDGGTLWVGPLYAGGTTAWILQAATGAVTATVPVFGPVVRLLDDQSALVTLGGGASQALTFLRPSDGSLLRTVDMTGPIMAAGITPSGSVVGIVGGQPRGTATEVVDGVALATTIDLTATTALDALAPSGALALTDSNPVRLWALPSGSVLRALDGNSAGAAFSPDSALLTYYTNAVVIENVAASNPVPTTPAGRLAVFSPDGTLLATANTDGTAQLFTTSLGTPVRTLGTATSGQAQALTAIAFAPDGGTLATGRLDTVKLWRTATGQLLETLTDQGLAGVPGGIGSLVFSADGARLFAVGTTGAGGLFAWDVAGGASTHLDSGGTSNIVLSAQEDALLLGGTNQVLRVATSDLSPLPPLATPGGIVVQLGLSADGHTLALGTISSTYARRTAVRIWCLP